MHQVHLLALPVRLWVQVQEQTEAVRREFALITMGGPSSTHTVPFRLLTLMASFDVRFAGVADAQEAELRLAAERGQMVIEDLVYQVPTEAAAAAQELDALLDEADLYCAEGTHLLTLAASEQVVSFRRWFLMQFVEQIAGKPPTPWPEWS